MIDRILSFFWWPLGWQLRLQKINAEERAGLVRFIREVYIPSVHAEAERQLKEADKPMLLTKFIKK